MRVLLDTCVVVDALQNREPFCGAAREIFLATANNRFIGCITAKSATDIYYLTHRHTHDSTAARAVLSKLFTLFDVLDTAGADCRHAIPSAISDYEDAVMVETAMRTESDCIVTRNIKDFSGSAVPVHTPEEFLRMIEERAEE